MEDAKPIDTPIRTSSKLYFDESGTSINETMYKVIIYSLFYLTASRLDIVFSVRMCVRFQSSPKESHLKAIKRILR